MTRTRSGLLPALVAVSAVGCAGHSPPRILPAPPTSEGMSLSGAGQLRVAGVTIDGGQVLMFDTLPSPRLAHDTVYATVAGAPYLITRMTIRQMWVARPGRRPTPVGTSDPGSALASAATVESLAAARVTSALRGERQVRVTIRSAGLINQVASIAALSAESIKVTLAGHLVVAAPLDSVQSLALRLGRRGSRVLAGLGIGAGVGAVLGGILGGVTALGCTGWACGADLIVGPALFGIIGATYGGIHGAVSRIWEPVPLEELRRLRVGIVPQPGGGLGFGASMAF